MKKMAVALICILCVQLLIGQQKPQYTQYILNNYIINPALSGIESYTDVKLSQRLQWVGLQGAPVTTYFTINTPLGKEDNRQTTATVQKQGENPRGKSYWENYEAAKPHSGIGLVLVDDHTGPLNNFNVDATYAYHIGLSPKTNLAVGFGLGITNLSLDRGSLYFETPVDPAVYNSGSVNTIKPDFIAGIWLYSADYFVGASAQQIITQNVSFTGNSVALNHGKLVPHLFGTAGYRFLLTDDVNMVTSVMVKYIEPLPVQLDFTVKLLYQDFLWVGANKRTYDGFAAMVGMNVSSKFNIGYSYDLTTSRLNTISFGTHEIILGFLIGNKYGDWCPRKVW